jgi:hypothetical protein
LIKKSAESRGISSLLLLDSTSVALEAVEEGIVDAQCAMRDRLADVVVRGV